MRQRYPFVEFNVYSDPVGSLTQYQGWHLGLEAVFPGRRSDEADSVALSIDLCHLDREARVMADVAWGSPSGQCEATLWDWTGTNAEWPLQTAARFDELERGIPQLLQVFAQAVERGYPSSRT